MYWYSISDELEEKAWAQADAQAENQGSNGWDGAAKFVGNLGELVIREFFSDTAPEEAWEYLNADAIDNAEPEYNDCDFKIHTGLKIDVKSTVDIRKFSPAYAYVGSEDEVPLGPSEKGFPTVDSDSESDVFIFVLLHTPEKPPPYPDRVEESTMGWAEKKEHTGNYLALVLGWMFTDAFKGEAVSNHLWQTPSGFTRFYVRELHELLLRTGLMKG
jgi:hypothetical protein